MEQKWTRKLRAPRVVYQYRIVLYGPRPLPAGGRDRGKGLQDVWKCERPSARDQRPNRGGKEIIRPLEDVRMLQPICPQPLSSWPACRSSSRAVLPQKNRRPSAGRTPPSPTAAAACPSSPTSPSCSHPPSVLRAAEGDHPRGLGADRAPRPCGPPSRPPAVHMPRLVPLALERLAFLPFLFVACRATEVKWLNPERGPIKGALAPAIVNISQASPDLWKGLRLAVSTCHPRLCLLFTPPVHFRPQEEQGF